MTCFKKLLPQVALPTSANNCIMLCTTNNKYNIIVINRDAMNSCLRTAYECVFLSKFKSISHLTLIGRTCQNKLLIKMFRSCLNRKQNRVY